MKLKIIALFFIIASSSSYVFCQGISNNQNNSKEHTYPVYSNKIQYVTPGNHQIYRDTRLGGSSPLYNTYKKNDYGAVQLLLIPIKMME